MLIRHIFIILILLISTTSYADIYKCKQANGSINYSNIPCLKENSMTITTLRETNSKNSIKELANIVTKTVSNTVGPPTNEGISDFSKINQKLIKAYGKSFNEIVFMCIKDVNIDKKHHEALIRFFKDINNSMSNGQDGINKRLLDKHPIEIVVIGKNISKYCAKLPFEMLRKIDS